MNDYHAAFEQLVESSSYKGQTWFGNRKYLVDRFGWAIPNDEVLTYISSTFDELIEVGAGEGYWAKCLDKRGTKVDAYDKTSCSRHYDVTCQDATELEDEIAGRPLLLIWPPVNHTLAEQMLVFFPSHILYVGEPAGGCTADDGFFEKLDKYYGLIKKIEIPSFEGANDNFYHYARNV